MSWYVASWDMFKGMADQESWEQERRLLLGNKVQEGIWESEDDNAARRIMEWKRKHVVR
jgi:hypothetical protein